MLIVAVNSGMKGYASRVMLGHASRVMLSCWGAESMADSCVFHGLSVWTEHETVPT